MISADAPAASIAVLAAAIGFHLTGSALLVAGAPPLAALHAFAAFIVLAIVATGHQLIPVLLRVEPAPWTQTVGPAAGFAVGFVLLIGAFMGAPLFAAAATALAVSTAFWCTFVGGRIFRAAGERQTAVAMACAFAGFSVAACFGAWMAYDLAGGVAVSQRIAAVHGTIMIAIFASLLIVALSYRFVPMFALAHANAYGRRVLTWVLLAGCASIAVGAAGTIGAGVSAVALMALAYQHVRTLKARLRKRLDPSLVYAAAAWLFAIAAAVLVAALGLTSATAVPVVALSLLGWLSITIFGYGMKICGFLSWQIARGRSPEAALAPLASAIPQSLAYVALCLLVLGAVLFSAGAAQWGSALYFTGALTYGATFLRIAYRYVYERHSLG